jgi:F-box/WD-40 domain protein 4
LSPFERLRICRNWKLGIYSEKTLLYSKTKYIPWLQLDKNLLWLSREGFIRAYRRNSKGINTREVVHCIKGKTRAEVCRFVKKKNYILSGQTDGSLWLWSVKDRKFVFDWENCHRADINTVDMSDGIMVTGSRDNYVKIWQKGDSSSCQKIDLRDRVWSVALSEENTSLLAIGTAGTSDISTVTVFDMSNQKFVAKLDSEILGAGVLDIKWESPATLWSCGYDSHLRRWDLRTGKCEQALGDPCGAAVYCFQYDHFNSIISGTQTNGRVVLWDTRQDNYVQVNIGSRSVVTLM